MQSCSPVLTTMVNRSVNHSVSPPLFPSIRSNSQAMERMLAALCSLLARAGSRFRVIRASPPWPPMSKECTSSGMREPPAPIDNVPTGHQWFPDIASAGGIITTVFYDSRLDPSYAPGLPPGNTAAGLSSGSILDVWSALSTDGGRTWTEQRVSSISFNPNWNNDVPPFMGDY